MSYTKAEQKEAITELKKHLKPSDTVYTVLRHVSQSGMLRVIDLYTIKNNKPVWLSYWTARALDMKQDKTRDGVRVGGCGMDMGFHLVYSLSSVLWPNGYKCTGDNCRSNDHTNGENERSKGEHSHRDGGYSLNHRWL